MFFQVAPATAMTPQLPTAPAPISQPFQIETSISQTQKESWLLEAIAGGQRNLAWQIAGPKFLVEYAGKTYSVPGLNIDLAYRGNNGRPLMVIIQQRADFYRRNPAALHRDLSDPDRVVGYLKPPPTTDVLIPGNVRTYTVLARGNRSWQQIGKKLYFEQMGMRGGVPQQILVYDAVATAEYTIQPSSFRKIGHFSIQ